MLTRLLRTAESVYWEQRLGIHTRGVVDGRQWGTHYSALPYGLIRRILHHLDLTPADVLCDLGSGKGRVLAMARRWPIRTVIGVEANPALMPIAARNLRPCPGCAPVQLIHALAQTVDYDDVTAVVMYQPFDEPTTDQVMQRIADSLIRHPRRFRLAYANAIFEAPLAKRFRKTGEWPIGTCGFTHRTSFWTHELTT